LARARKWVALATDLWLSSGRLKWRADSRGTHFLDFSILRLEMPADATGAFCQILL